MAAVHGKGGSVTFSPGEVSAVQTWEYNSVGELAETTAMGDTWASFEEGLTDFSASVEALAKTETDYTGDIGQESTLTLTLETGKTVSANAISTSITEAVSIDDVGRASMEFVGDAASVTYPS